MSQPNPEIHTAPDAGSAKHYQRKVGNIIIHRPIQREFTLVVIVLFMISMLAIGLIIHYTIREAAFGGGFHFGKINPYEVLSEVSYQLILWVSCVLFATLMVIGFFGIFFLHRIAGPVYRFRQIFAKLNSGHIPHSIRLREGDFFNEVADEINRHLKWLAGEIEKRQKIRQNIDQILSQGASESIQKSAQEIKDLLSPPLKWQSVRASLMHVKCWIHWRSYNFNTPTASHSFTFGMAHSLSLSLGQPLEIAHCSTSR